MDGTSTLGWYFRWWVVGFFFFCLGADPKRKLAALRYIKTIVLLPIVGCGKKSG